MVRFTALRDREGHFFFAPLGGQWFRDSIPEPDWAALSDSVVVRTLDGCLLTKAAAVRHILRRLGGPWRLLAALAGAIPARALDALYESLRRGPPALAPAAAVLSCRPPELRSRFRS